MLCEHVFLCVGLLQFWRNLSELKCNRSAGEK